MNFITINTKTGEKYSYNDWEVERLFEDNKNMLSEKCILKEEYEYVINNPEEFFGDKQELTEFINEWNSGWRQILNKKEYLKELIEVEEWCSPRGIESVFKVIEVEEQICAIYYF